MSTVVNLRRPAVIGDNAIETVRMWQKHTSDNIDQLVAGINGVGSLAGPISRLRSNALGLTSGTAANVGATVSLVLTAGRWNVRGAVGFLPAATTSITQLIAAVSATSATLPASDTSAVPTAGEVLHQVSMAAMVNGGSPWVVPIPAYNVTVASGNTLTLYLVGQATFTVSTLTAYGWLEAQQAALR